MSKNEKAALTLVGALVVYVAAHKVAADQAAVLGIPVLGVTLAGAALTMMLS